MGGVGGVLHDTFCFAGASCKKDVQDGGERGTNDCIIYMLYIHSLATLLGTPC